MSGLHTLKVLLTIIILFLTSSVKAAEYYCDASSSGNNADGTESAPWNWNEALDNLIAGDTLYCTGDFGLIKFDESDPYGTNTNYITFTSWPGQSDPCAIGIRWIYSNAVNCYHVIDDWDIDVGFLEDADGDLYENNAIFLDNASFVTIQNSNLEGAKVAGSELINADWAPYVFSNNPTCASNPQSICNSITFDSCTIRYGYNGIKCWARSEGSQQNWKIIDCDISRTGNDCITITGDDDSKHYLTIDGCYLHDQHEPRLSCRYNGSATGNWTGHEFETVTQDVSGATGIFWKIKDDKIRIFDNNQNHPQSTLYDTSSHIWRLDSDPENTFWTPGGYSDNAHIDLLGVEGGGYVTVKNTIFLGHEWGEQVIKLSQVGEGTLDSFKFENCLITATKPRTFVIGLASDLNDISFVNCTIDSDITDEGSPYPQRSLRSYNDWYTFNDVYFKNCIINHGSSSLIKAITGSLNCVFGNTPDAVWNADSSCLFNQNMNTLFNSRGSNYQLSANSPAIAIGNQLYQSQSTDIAGNPWTTSPSIGAYEYTGIFLVSDDVSVAVGESSTITVQINNPENQTLTYEVTGLPTGATYTVVDGSLLISWPDDVERGTYTPTVTATNGSDSTSTSFTVTVGSDDYTDPSVSGMTPSANAIQAPLNTMISCHVTDAGDGVNASTVVIKVDGTTVYTGNVSSYTSSLGVCRRSGTTADYAYAFQYSDNLSYDQEVTVTVNASDQAGNAMTTVTSSFTTEMRLFGDNTAAVDTGSYDQAHMSTVTDSSGNKWMAWHMGDSGERDVYVGLVDGSSGEITSPVRVTSDQSDQCYPQIAIDSSNRLYLTWQSNSRGVWDVLFGTSLDGINWTITRAVDSDYDQTQPVMACNTDATVYIAFEDNRNGNQDIYLSSSSNLFASNTVTAITSNSASQTSPALAIDTSLVVYVAWQDERNGNSDIYGATSAGSWANQALITGTGDQTDPALAVDSLTSTAHLLWVDDSAGDLEVYYASSTGFSDGPLTATSFIDDSTGADQSEPTLITYSTDSRTNIFACWTDSRSIAGSTDTDLYFADLGSGTAHTNVLVGDDSTNSNQSQPFLGLDDEGSPYLVWADDRDSVDTLYYVGNTYINPTPFKSELITASTGGTVGVAPASIDDTSDVSVQLPANACDTDVTITISEIENPPALDMPTIAAYDFGPSNIDFDEPVTITIPYEVSDATASAYPYWYNSLTDGLSQQGITDIERIVISDTIHALTFKTTHFTPYYLVNSTSSVSASASSGGGGCSVMPGTSPMNPVEFFLPFGIVVLVISVLRYRDRRSIA